MSTCVIVRGVLGDSSECQNLEKAVKARRNERFSNTENMLLKHGAGIWTFTAVTPNYLSEVIFCARLLKA